MQGHILSVDNFFNLVVSFLKMVFIPKWKNVSDFEAIVVIPFFDAINGFITDRKFIRLMALAGFFIVWLMSALMLLSVAQFILSSVHNDFLMIFKGYFGLVGFCYLMQVPQKVKER